MAEKGLGQKGSPEGIRTLGVLEVNPDASKVREYIGKRCNKLAFEMQCCLIQKSYWEVPSV